MVYNDKIRLNLYVNFILNSLPSNENSILEVCDCENFIVVKGTTTHTEVINLNELNHKFDEKYPNIKSKNTIDLISYDRRFEDKQTYEFLFNNESNSKPYSRNENSFFTTSDFPWGRSWSNGKLLYFYFKFITNKIPSNYPFNWISYKVEVDENNKVDFEIQDDYMNNEKDILKSSILDCFNFNLNELETIAKKMDLEKFILNPKDNSIFSEINTEDFLII